MFHRVTCPSCQHKFTIPEGDVGKLANCPNCQTPFKAGKSVAEADIPMKLQPQPVTAGINKTMLGETEPPIKYNCPRCKKPLESPSIEAGTKKPCPACGQRLQIPAAPRPSAPQPAINKTMLAADESIQPMQQAPMPAPPVPVPTSKKKADPDDRAQPSGAGRFYTTATLVGGGVFFLSLLACVGVMMVSGGESKEMVKARQDFLKAQQDLVELKRSIELKEALVAQKLELSSQFQKLMDKVTEAQNAQQRALDDQKERDKKNTDIQNDKDRRAKADEEYQRKQDEINRVANKAKDDKAQADRELASVKSQLDAANRQAQQATIIVSQPPPPPYYNRYDPRYYWGY